MTPHRFPGSMTARQFDKVAKQVSMSPMMLARARRVLVEGEHVQDVADSEGVTNPRVYAAIHKIEAQLDSRR